MLAVQERSTECARTPLPESDIAVGELEASLTSDIPPVRVPVVVGSKFTLKEVLWPTARVRGRVRPLRLYPEPDRLAWDTVVLPVPVLLMVTGSVLDVFTVTFPKLRLVELGVIRPEDVAPVPLSDTLVGEFDASLTNDKLPDTVPVTLGAKSTLNEVF